MQLALISLFGVIGVLSRFGLDMMIATRENSFPWNTFIVNMLGCTLAGMLYVLAEKEMLSVNLQVALLVGFCGGFTTFSAYALQTVLLFDKAKAMTALIYFLVSPTLGILTALVAVKLMRKILV